MRITKMAMARVIVQALYNLPTLPAETDRRVVKMAARTVEWLEPRYNTAHAVLTAKVSEIR